MNVENQTQFGQEHTAWQRQLDLLMQENALMKYRLSEMVDESEEKSFLQMAEYFQNELLLKDEALNKLIKESKNFAEKFQKVKDIPGVEGIIGRQNDLRKRIAQFEKEFLKLSNQFNQKMLREIKH